jgi:hypothetical protein
MIHGLIVVILTALRATWFARALGLVAAVDRDRTQTPAELSGG